MELARGAFERKNSFRYARWLELTVAIGLAFLTSQVFALKELAGQGIYLRNNPHSSLFYVLTGVHGLHLLGGMAALSYLLIKAISAARSRIVRFQAPARPRGGSGVVLAFSGGNLAVPFCRIVIALALTHAPGIAVWAVVAGDFPDADETESLVEAQCWFVGGLTISRRAPVPCDRSLVIVAWSNSCATPRPRYSGSTAIDSSSAPRQSVRVML